MELNVWFDIIISKMQGGNRYKMRATHIWSSEQVERFKITGGDRYILMEKRLDNHKQPWKITEGNFKTGIDTDKATWAIMEMKEILDHYLKNRNGQFEGQFIFKPDSWTHPKNKDYREKK
jgi:hypothetical protein